MEIKLRIIVRQPEYVSQASLIVKEHGDDLECILPDSIEGHPISFQVNKAEFIRVSKVLGK